MVLTLDLEQDAQGRMLGTVRQEERGIVRTFDGIIELVAILESCLAHESPEKDS